MNCLMWLWIFLHVKFVYGVYTAAKETEIRSETALATLYDPVSRPESQTEVKVGLNLMAIDTLELKVQTFSTAGWLSFEWTDSRLTWDKTAKDDIEYIYCKPSTVWIPELVIDNSLADLGVVTDTNLLVKVRYDGTVEWEPPLLFTTHCEIDITYYPYDQQKCAIEIVSWGYTYNEVKLSHLKSEINLEDFMTNGEWIITKTVIEEKNLTEQSTYGTVLVYPQLEFWIYLERRTDFYNLNVMLPTFLMSLLIVLVFIVPVESGEKLSFVLTVLLSLSVLLTLVSNSLPTTSVTISVLGLYLGIVLVLAAVAVLLTVLIMILSHKDGNPTSNSCLLAIYRFALNVTCKLATTESVNNCKVAPTKENDQPMNDGEIICNEIGASNVDMTDVTWKELAHVTDKFCFVIFLVITCVTNISFITALTVGGHVNEP